jgi:hypothetical protein
MNFAAKETGQTGAKYYLFTCPDTVRELQGQRPVPYQPGPSAQFTMSQSNPKRQRRDLLRWGTMCGGFGNGVAVGE